MSVRADSVPMPEEPTPARAMIAPKSAGDAPARADDLLLASIRSLGDQLYRLKKQRVACQLQIGAMEREYGSALPELHATFDALKHIEHQAKLQLCRIWRRHPLAGWANGYRGVGEESIAMLIAHIGDPADRANVAKLWSYCGLNPERRRRAGMSQEEALACGNPRARAQLWRIATRMLMSGNRDVYDARRAATAERDGWTDGHKHNDALRIVAKDFVKQLWIASRRPASESHSTPVGGDS